MEVEWCYKMTTGLTGTRNTFVEQVVFQDNYGHSQSM